MPLSDEVCRVSLILDACEQHDRRGAAALLREDIAKGPQLGKGWYTAAMLATKLGETDMALEAARRFANTAPDDLQYVLFYALTLSHSHQFEAALAQLNGLPKPLQDHPTTLYFRALTATQLGALELAQSLLHQAIDTQPHPAFWLALATAKTFGVDDPDIGRMELAQSTFQSASPEERAQLSYALGKAYEDIKDFPNAAKAFTMASGLMQGVTKAENTTDWDGLSLKTTKDFTLKSMAELIPSGAEASRMVFVTGFPRSGTTLVEQILTSHSAFCGGAELNTISIALMTTGQTPTKGLPIVNGYKSYADAIAYQNKSQSKDPWGDIGRDYLEMVAQRLGPRGKAIDKTLNIGSSMGLLLHALPTAKFIWLQRRPEDCALSNYKMYMENKTLPWSYSFEDIAAFFKAEDRLFAHWTKLFPDRILIQSYEALVSDPKTQIKRLFDYIGLETEPQVFTPHLSKRAVTTASVAQVRAPISKQRIGAATAYGDLLETFKRAYYPPET
jgi:tetratricopeptide (TPR) repeat protein